MINEFEAYHGSALRDVIVCAAPNVISIQAFDDVGRLNTFRLNGHTGLHIKHCSSRLSPWGFAVTKSVATELRGLGERVSTYWLALVCGEDGVVFLSAEKVERLIDLNSSSTQNIRVERKKRQMYRISGTSGILDRPVRRGAAEIADHLTESGG